MTGKIHITGGDINTTSMLVHAEGISYKEDGQPLILVAADFHDLTHDYTAEKKEFTTALLTELAGGALFSSAGALAGVLAGGNKKAVAFTATLKDMRVFHAVTDAQTYLALSSIAAEALQRRASENAVDEILEAYEYKKRHC